MGFRCDHARQGSPRHRGAAYSAPAVRTRRLFAARLPRGSTTSLEGDGEMDWNAIAAIAELLAAVGVIASLVYLATQIRQNTRTTRAASFQSAASEAAQDYRLIAGDAEVARIFRVGLIDPDQLTDDESVRFLMVMSAIFRGYENLFVQHRYGTAEEDSWAAWRSSLQASLAAPGAARFWGARGGVFREDFQALVAESAPVGFPEPGSGAPFGPAV